MSIKIMSHVWENGPDDRGELLVLLALADFADDKGRCWPSVTTLAKRARMTTRSVQRIIRKMQGDGKLSVSIGTGRSGCNEYVLTPDACVTPDTTSPLTPASPPHDARVTHPLTPVSPEPSLNHHEPSVEPLLVPLDEKPKRPKRKPEVELPEGWVPNDKNIQDAQERGFTQKEMEHEADNFRNYHSSKQSLYRDWDAAWRMWLGNAIKFGRRGGLAGKAAPGGYGQDRSIASIAAQRRFDGSV